MEIIWLCVATTFFTGFLPVRLTGGRLKWGGLMGALFGFGLQLLLLATEHAAIWLTVAAVLSLVIGTYSVGPAASWIFKRYGARLRHNGEWTSFDYNEINVDEVHGQLLSAIPIAWFVMGGWQFIFLNLASFALFRLIDCKKIWPVSVAEKRLKGPWGVMLDDTVGGIMTAILVTLLGLFVR